MAKHKRIKKGDQFGRWTAISGQGEVQASRVECQCDCGQVRLISVSNLRSRKTTSCGCYHRQVVGELNKTHGLSGSPEHKAWKAMRKRCNNKNTNSYASYGGRGISVCERWGCFENFLSDMGHKPGPGYSLDRIDNDKGYEPDNCRWATFAEQSVNKRDNVMLSCNGKTQTVSQWSKEVGLRRSVIATRLRRGWGVQEAITRPSRRIRPS